jgi:hypothetical protein
VTAARLHASGPENLPCARSTASIVWVQISDDHDLRASRREDEIRPPDRMLIFDAATTSLSRSPVKTHLASRDEAIWQHFKFSAYARSRVSRFRTRNVNQALHDSPTYLPYRSNEVTPRSSSASHLFLIRAYMAIGANDVPLRSRLCFRSSKYRQGHAWHRLDPRKFFPTSLPLPSLLRTNMTCLHGRAQNGIYLCVSGLPASCFQNHPDPCASLILFL